MCGIVGYTGFQDAYNVVINGLRRWEYRGYDSAGIVLDKDQGNFTVAKTKGKVEDLENISKDLKGTAHVGMGHTRWATHGVPSDRNSHPHVSNNNKNLSSFYPSSIPKYFHQLPKYFFFLLQEQIAFFLSN